MKFITSTRKAYPDGPTKHKKIVRPKVNSPVKMKKKPRMSEGGTMYA